MTSRWPSESGEAIGAKPRVLLVDDHRGVLDNVAAALAKDFEVAGTATDGEQAVAVAGQCSPDAIVLDINMPGLDGFQTKDALDRAGCRAPVVFLSTFDSEEHVGAAFRRGARGYVVKAFTVRDLTHALHHVLHGRLFVPSLPPLVRLAHGGDGHAMQLYGDPGKFLDGLAEFFDRALLRGDAACVIATPEVRDGLGARLRRRGWNIEGDPHQTRYLALDAARAIERFMRDGRPDRAILAEIASELDRYRLAACSGPASRLIIFGNMTRVLIGADNPDAAIELERQWNAVTHDLPFFTLCGYSTASFHDAPDLWADAFAEHWAVSHANGV